MKKKVIFLGTNSVLERQIESCERQNQEIAGIIDSDWFGNTEIFCDLPVLDSETIFDSEPEKYKDFVFFIGVNWYPYDQRDIQKRKMFINLIRRHQLDCINLIDPTSYVSRYTTLGKGIFIGPGVNIEPHSIIEDFATLYGHNGVGHHNRIGENSILQREAIIHAQIGCNTYVGIGSAIIQDYSMTIGNNVVISPCLHVARNVKDNEKVSLSKDNFRVYRRLNQGTSFEAQTSSLYVSHGNGSAM